jgi:hypothetical protein
MKNHAQVVRKFSQVIPEEQLSKPVAKAFLKVTETLA